MKVGIVYERMKELQKDISEMNNKLKKVKAFSDTFKKYKSKINIILD